MKYNIKRIREEIKNLDLRYDRNYHLTSATYKLREESTKKGLVPIMLDCCLG